MDTTQKAFTVEEIKQKLQSSPSWQERALIVLFQYQTRDEQVAEATKHDNDKGFNATDARILSSFAKQLQRRPGYHLSTKQAAIAAKKLPKYAKQLWTIQQGKVQ